MYSIQDLEKLSGIKAHTIRIWEKRYDLLIPDRTNTNIRRYSDDQLRKLLNVTALLKHGDKISKIGGLGDKEIAQRVENLLKPELKDEQCEVFVNQLIISGVNYDSTMFESTFSSAITRFGMHNCYVNVILPMLIRVGLLWGKDELVPAQEHFISNMIRQKLFSAIDGLPPSSSKKKFVLFLPADEDHEIGLLLAYYLIKQAGNEVVYLGQSVPVENIKKCHESVRPDFLLLFLVRSWGEGVNSVIDSLQVKTKTIICGSSEVTRQITESSNRIIVNNITDLNKYL